MTLKELNRLTPFLTLFQLYDGGQCTHPCFSGQFFVSAFRTFFSVHRLLSYETIVSAERGINSVALTSGPPDKKLVKDRTSDPLFSDSSLYRLSHMGSALVRRISRRAWIGYGDIAQIIPKTVQTIRKKKRNTEDLNCCCKYVSYCLPLVFSRRGHIPW